MACARGSPDQVPLRFAGELVLRKPSSSWFTASSSIRVRLPLVYGHYRIKQYSPGMNRAAVRKYATFYPRTFEYLTLVPENGGFYYCAPMHNATVSDKGSGTYLCICVNMASMPY